MSDESMSENSEFDRAAAEKQYGSTPDAAAEVDAVEGDAAAVGRAAEGQYVEGDYGTAGVADENLPETADGEYATGDYGTAGDVGEAPTLEEGR